MSAAWITILVLTVLTVAIRAAGPLLLGGRDLPPAVQEVIALLAPALLAALVVVETVGAPEGGALDIDERLAGVLAAGGVLYAGGSTLPAIAVAAVVTAGLRAVA
jgi:branched-subunit amino acid transport protein